MKELIKVGYCVAYDWKLLAKSLPLIYDGADSIILSLDKDRISWSRQRFDFDEQAFELFVRSVDTKGKIKIFEDNFHLQGLTPMQNEVRQRNAIAREHGEGGWHIQLDCDEYFIGFSDFVCYLHSIPVGRTKRTNICCPWIVLYKEVPEGFLVVNYEQKENVEFIQVATREPRYEYGRRNGDFNILTQFPLLHQSWARASVEIWEKVRNWGHSTDFDSERFCRRWDSIDLSNYQTFRNLHPVKPTQFPSLKFCDSSSIVTLFGSENFRDLIYYSKLDFILANSKQLSRLRKLARIIRGIFK